MYREFTLATQSPPEVSDELLAEVSRRFYLEGESKVDIGQDLGLSRFRVARMIDEARNRGIVRIEVIDTLSQNAAQALDLADHLGLKRVTLVKGSADVHEERNELGRATARLLVRLTKPEDVIGLSWGRTLLPMAKYLENLPATTLVQLTGAVGADLSTSPVEIISRILQTSDVKPMVLLAPLFAATPESALSFKQEPSVASVFEMYKKLDTAILSVGSWKPSVTQLGQLFGEETVREIDDSGAVAELAGIFLSADGHYVDLSINARRLSVSVPELLRTPTVMAVAGGMAKIDAIRSVAQSGLIDTLVTTTEVGARLLEMPRITQKVLERNPR